MPLDAEEFKRRRELRKQQQAQQVKKRRKRLRLAILLTAGVLCVALVLLLVLPKPQSSDTPSTENEEAPQNKTVIHFVAGGDVNINDRTAAQDLDYTAAFLDVAHLLSSGNITALNFEGNLLGAPYGSATASAPQAMMQALSRAGVDFIQLANSYSIHNGMAGLLSTISGVEQSGMTPLGVYSSSAEFNEENGFSLIDVQGVKIALVAFTKGMDGLALPAGNENCVNVLYKDYQSTYQTVNTEGITEILDKVNRIDPDITIALLHWGSEFNDTISSSQEKVCQLMQDGGVDVILGTHSHYVQKMTLDPNTGNFVAWSLGDFISDADRAGSEYSVVLDLEITKDNDTGNTRVTGFSYTPIFTINEEGKPLRVVRIHEAIAAYDLGYMDKVSEATYNAMKYALDRIEVRIHGPKESIPSSLCASSSWALCCRTTWFGN